MNISEDDEMINIAAKEWIYLLKFINDNKERDIRTNKYYIDSLKIRTWINENTFPNGKSLLLKIFNSPERILFMTRIILDGERKSIRFNNQRLNRIYFNDCELLQTIRNY